MYGRAKWNCLVLLLKQQLQMIIIIIILLYMYIDQLIHAFVYIAIDFMRIKWIWKAARKKNEIRITGFTYWPAIEHHIIWSCGNKVVLFDINLQFSCQINMWFVRLFMFIFAPFQWRLNRLGTFKTNQNVQINIFRLNSKCEIMFSFNHFLRF